MVEESVTHYDYLLVGGGMAAGFAARGIREVDEQGSIGVITTDMDEPYTRPALSKKLWTDDSFTEDKVPLKTKEKTGADIFLKKTVTVIDKDSKRVKTADGRQFSYNKLLLSTGGEPKRLEGPDDERVLAFRSFEDYRLLRKLSGNQRHVIVVGGSYIGTELAANLALNDTRVTFIYPQEKLSGNRFVDELAQEYEKRYRQNGITLMNRSRAASYDVKGKDIVVTLESGETVTGDGLVLGIGVEPRLELAEEAGLTIDNGVMADEFLTASDPDIFAAGDIVSYPDPILGRNRIEHVDHARKSGKTAGKNMAGAGEAYNYTPYFYSDVFDLSWQAIGKLDPELDYYIDKVDGGKVIYYLEDEKPVGIITWNIEADMDDVRAVLKNPPASKDALKGLIREKGD